MNERFSLNGKIVRDWLDREFRKQTYLANRLGVSDSLVDRMLNGHVPKEKALTKLAQLMGVPVERLLIPKAKAG